MTMPAFVLGLFAAAQDLDVQWIAIKGVSDYANETKSESDSWRRFASVMAASLTAEILSDYFRFQNWPHYGGERFFFFFLEITSKVNSRFVLLLLNRRSPIS